METALTVAGSAVGLAIGVSVLHIKVFRPMRRSFHRARGRVIGALDNLGGREAFVDDATGRTVPAIPPLGERLTGIEDTLIALSDVNGRLDNHESRLDGLDSVVGALVGDKYERGAEAALTAVIKANAGAVDEEGEP